MIGIGVIGCGQWGPNHIRNFSAQPSCKVVAVADINVERLGSIKQQYKGIAVYEDYHEMFEKSKLDAVVICTPTKTHYQIAKDALLSRKHVLCEKPLCDRVERGEELVHLATANNLILMVGHVFLFNSGIVKLKECIELGYLGKIYYLAATHTNLGPIRSDVNSVYDLASHDISIFNYLIEQLPVEVSAVGMRFLQKGIEDVAFVSLRYPRDILAHIRVSWLDPQKVRQITIVGSKKMITWDDLSPMGPVMIYDKGVINEELHYEDYGQFQLLPREGEITIPKLKLEEPLKTEIKYFLACIRNKSIRISNGTDGVNALRVLEAINESLSLNGAPVNVEQLALIDK